MSRGHTRPLTVCDRDCAGANGCHVGGYQCDGCGLWFCGEDLNQAGDTLEYLCDDCLAAREQEESEDDTEGSEQGPAQAAQGQTS